MLRPSPAAAGLSAALSLLAVFLVLRDAELLQWIGAALLLALAWAWAPQAARLPLARLRPALPWLALTALGLALLGELALGRPPATRDHGIHYFQTALLLEDLLPRGQLVGWSDRLGNGYAFGESYPVVGYLWMGALHLLSLGAVSLRASYAFGILAMWALSAWGVARLGTLIAAETLPVENSTDGRKPSTVLAWAGAIGAGLWLLDPGGSREGGWNYLMFHGVWPQLLSTALWIAALPLTWGALLRPSPRRICLAGGALGLAILAHPFALLTVATSAVGWLALLLLRPPERPDGGRGGHGWTWFAVHALAAMLSAGWLAGFLGSADAMGRTPVPWQAWGEAATALVAGELFDGHRAWIGPLALIGLALALRRGRVIGWLVAGLLLVTLVLASDAAITALRLDLLVSAFKNLQFPRYAIGLKPLWFALAGVGAAAVLTRVFGRFGEASSEFSTDGRKSESEPKLRVSAPATLACVLLAPVAVGVVGDLDRLAPGPVGRVGSLEGSEHAATDQALLAALRAEQAHGPLTVAFLRQGMGGGMYPVFAVTDAGARLVLDGHIPSINTEHRIESRKPGLLRGLGVTHLLHDQPLGRREAELAAALEPVVTAGPYTLARLKPAALPQALPGVARWDRKDVTVSAEPDVDHLRVAGPADRPVRLDLVRAPHRKWRATLTPDAGAPIELAMTPITLLGGVTGTHLELPGPGLLELRFEVPTGERRARWASLIAAAACLVGLAFARPLQFAERLQSPAARRLSRGLTLALVGLLALLGLRRQQQQLARTWEAEGRLLADLAGAAAVEMRPADLCDGLTGRDAKAGCSAAQFEPRTASLFREPYLYRCTWVTVPAKGATTIRLAHPGAATLRGYLQVQTPPAWTPSKRGELRLRVDRSAERRLGARVERFEVAGERATLKLLNERPTHEAVCVAAAALAE